MPRVDEQRFGDVLSNLGITYSHGHYYQSGYRQQGRKNPSISRADVLQRIKQAGSTLDDAVLDHYLAPKPKKQNEVGYCELLMQTYNSQNAQNVSAEQVKDALDANNIRVSHTGRNYYAGGKSIKRTDVLDTLNGYFGQKSRKDESPYSLTKTPCLDSMADGAQPVEPVETAAQISKLGDYRMGRGVGSRTRKRVSLRSAAAVGMCALLLAIPRYNKVSGSEATPIRVGGGRSAVNVERVVDDSQYPSFSPVGEEDGANDTVDAVVDGSLPSFTEVAASDADSQYLSFRPVEEGADAEPSGGDAPDGKSKSGSEGTLGEYVEELRTANPDNATGNFGNALLELGPGAHQRIGDKVKSYGRTGALEAMTVREYGSLKTGVQNIGSGLGLYTAPGEKKPNGFFGRAGYGIKQVGKGLVVDVVGGTLRNYLWDAPGAVIRGANSAVQGVVDIPESVIGLGANEGDARYKAVQGIAAVSEVAGEFIAENGIGGSGTNRVLAVDGKRLGNGDLSGLPIVHNLAHQPDGAVPYDSNKLVDPTTVFNGRAAPNDNVNNKSRWRNWAETLASPFITAGEYVGAGRLLFWRHHHHHHNGQNGGSGGNGGTGGGPGVPHGG